jgi:threonine/homoserine/homoserine lactone efflux protein
MKPPPYNSGIRVYDFYDSFSAATSNGPDNHFGAARSVGEVFRKSVYSAVGGTIIYTVTLLAVTYGKRLNFWTSMGIKNGAGTGGET